MDYHAKLLGEPTEHPLPLVEASRRLIGVVDKIRKADATGRLRHLLTRDRIYIWIDQVLNGTRFLPNPNQLAAQKHFAFQPLQRPVLKPSFLSERGMIKPWHSDQNPRRFVAQLHEKKGSPVQTLTKEPHQKVVLSPTWYAANRKQLAECLKQCLGAKSLISHGLAHYGERGTPLLTSALG